MSQVGQRARLPGSRRDGSGRDGLERRVAGSVRRRRSSRIRKDQMRVSEDWIPNIAFYELSDVQHQNDHRHSCLGRPDEPVRPYGSSRPILSTAASGSILHHRAGGEQGRLSLRRLWDRDHLRSRWHGIGMSRLWSDDGSRRYGLPEVRLDIQRDDHIFTVRVPEAPNKSLHRTALSHGASRCALMVERRIVCQRFQVSGGCR